MVTLADVRDYLKSFNLFQGYYVGRINANEKNVLGVYDLRYSARHKTVGSGTQKYDVKAVSLLVHGDGNKTSTEQLAIRLHEALESAENATIAGRKVNVIELRYDAPIDVDVSESGTYEYVIEAIFYVEREG